MLRYHTCPVHGKESCLMGGENGDVKSHGCRGGVQLVFVGPVQTRLIGVIDQFIERMNK